MSFLTIVQIYQVTSSTVVLGYFLLFVSIFMFSQCFKNQITIITVLKSFIVGIGCFSDLIAEQPVLL